MACTLSSTNFFGELPRQIDVIDGSYEEIQPVNSIDKIKPRLEFIVKGNEKFIDLNRTYLVTQIKVSKNDGTDLKDDSGVSCINYIGATLYNSVDLFVNNDQLASISNYGYKSLIEFMLTYGKEAKKCMGEAGLFYQNRGQNSRKEWLAKSNVVEVISRLHVDMFNSAEMLMNNVDVKLVFSTNSSEFCIIQPNTDNDAHKIEIVDATLVVYRNTLSDSALVRTMNTLAEIPAQIHCQNGRVLTYTKASGVQNIEIPNAIIGSKLPNLIVIAMVDNKAFSGDAKMDPFQFQHFNISKFDIKVDSRSVYPKPLTFDMDKKMYLSAYWFLLSSMGYVGRDDGCTIDRKAFADGNFLLAADLTPTQSGGAYEDPLKMGNVSIEMQFKRALAKTINIIVYFEYTATVHINELRKALVDYNF